MNVGKENMAKAAFLFNSFGTLAQLDRALLVIEEDGGSNPLGADLLNFFLILIMKGGDYYDKIHGRLWP